MASRSRTPIDAHRGQAMSGETASTIGHDAGRPVRQPRFQTEPLELVLIAGLAGVFLVNAVVALVESSELRQLVEHSFLGRLIPAMNGRWVAWAVAVNDVAVGASLLATPWLPRARRFVLAWAGLWLLAVALRSRSSRHWNSWAADSACRRSRSSVAPRPATPVDSEFVILFFISTSCC